MKILLSLKLYEKLYMALVTQTYTKHIESNHSLIKL